MESLSLGPNGAILYALEYLEANLDWLLNEITAHQDLGAIDSTALCFFF
jgi:hypothetical protein